MISVSGVFIQEIDCVFDLEFGKGINILEGNNGSGKTLILDRIAGIADRKMNHDKISINGTSIYLRQNFSFHSELSVFEYIEYIMALSDMTYDSFLIFISKYNIDINFSELEKKKIGLLSGGERRTLYLLSVLSIPRDWYILDEPFVNIDEDKKALLFKLIEDMSHDDKSFLITSHETVRIEGLFVVNL